MIYKKIKRPAPTPLMGRQLFRGQVAPLILAGGSGVSPNVYAAAYSVATDVITSEATPAAKPFVATCDMTQEEREWCAYWPGLPFCEKMKIPQGDPKCEALSDPSLKPKCGMSDKLRRICAADSKAFDPKSPDYPWTSFCTLQKVNGLCIDDVERLESERIEKEKQRIDESMQELNKLEEEGNQKIKLYRTCVRVIRDGKVINDLCPIPEYLRKDLGYGTPAWGVDRDSPLGNLRWYRMTDEQYKKINNVTPK
jgi:hypothetical protein